VTCLLVAAHVFHIAPAPPGFARGSHDPEIFAFPVSSPRPLLLLPIVTTSIRRAVLSLLAAGEARRDSVYISAGHPPPFTNHTTLICLRLLFRVLVPHCCAAAFWIAVARSSLSVVHRSGWRYVAVAVVSTGLAE
jgi:hypothetical protein